MDGARRARSGQSGEFGRLSVKIQLPVQYVPVHPRISGQEWNVQVQITRYSKAHQGHSVPVTQEDDASTPFMG